MSIELGEKEKKSNQGPIFRSHKSQITKGPKSTNHKNPIFRSICKNAKINCSSFEFVKKVRDLTGKKENFEDGFWGNPWTKMDTQGCFGIRRSCRIWFWPSAHLTLTFEIGRPTPARDWLGWKWKRELSQSFLGLFWHFFVSVALRILRPIWLWPLRGDWLRSRSLGAARSSQTDLGISWPFLAQFSNFLCPWHSEFQG